MGVMVSLDVFHKIIEVSAAEHVRSILPWGKKELFFSKRLCGDSAM